MARLVAALVFSGAASLMYQVAWTRRLISVTSATAISQAIVLAVFMAGLGLGAAIAGKICVKTRRPFRAYALVELLAAALAALSLPLIGASLVVADLFRGLGADAAMWLQLGSVSLFLLIPTTLLGASLPLVLEGVDRFGLPAPVGLLYGVNTLGAALGCAFAGFWAIEHVGLISATLAGAGAAMIAAALALQIPAPAVAGQKLPETHGEPIDRRWLFASAAAGFVGLGAEIVLTRLFAAIIYNTVYAFTTVLLGVLIGVALGGFFAGAVARRADENSMIFRAAGVSQAASVVLLALVPTGILGIAGVEFVKTDIARGTSPVVAVLVLGIMGAPLALNAAVLPLLVSAARATRSARALGDLYAANIAGGVAGSLLLGIAVLPAIGLHASLGLLVAIGLSVAFLLLREGRGTKRAATISGLAALTALLLLFSYNLPHDAYRALLPEDHQIVALEEGRSSDVMITDDSRGRRRIWINSTWVATAGGGTGFGHRVLGFFPGLLHPSPSRALGIALGTGQTFAAILTQGVEHLDCVDINPMVVKLSREYFREANGGLLDRPEVTVHIEDGRAFLRAAKPEYDLIVLEPLQSWSAGTSSLYSREFYRDAKKVLTPGGVLLQWIPFYGQGAAETQAMVKTGAAIFPRASLWLTGTDGMMILHNDDSKLDPEAITARLRSRGSNAVLSKAGVIEGADVLSHLVLGPKGVAAWTANAEIIEDDRPFLEFAAARSLDRETTYEIIESLAPVFEADDLSDYLAGTSSVAAEVRAVRRAMINAWRHPYQAREARASALERGLDEAPGSTRLRVYHRAYLDSWVEELKHKGASAAELEAVLRRAR